MDWNPSCFNFIKTYPYTTYNIVYNDFNYTIKPSSYGQGLFANQTIEKDTSLGELVPVSSNLYPFYLKNYCENAINNMHTSRRPQRQSLQQRFTSFYNNHFDDIAKSIEQQAKHDHLQRLGSNYFFMTNMHTTVGVLNTAGDLPEIEYTHLLLDTTQTPFAFSNSSKNKRGLNNPNVVNVQVDYDASVKTTKTINAGDEIRWAYDWQ